MSQLPGRACDVHNGFLKAAALAHRHLRSFLALVSEMGPASAQNAGRCSKIRRDPRPRALRPRADLCRGRMRVKTGTRDDGTQPIWRKAAFSPSGWRCDSLSVRLGHQKENKTSRCHFARPFGLASSADAYQQRAHSVTLIAGLTFGVSQRWGPFVCLDGLCTSPRHDFPFPNSQRGFSR